MKELHTQLLIAGGGVGGCAAALAACGAGLDVVLAEECDWVGGQFTAQATPPDEHGWIEEFGCTRGYRRFRELVREHYRLFYPLTDAARGNPRLNPGNGWVSPLCAEPRAFHAVFQKLLGRYEEKGNLRILLEHTAAAADRRGDRVASVTLESTATGERKLVYADYFIDATDLGELLPLTGTEFVTGAESRAETGEPSAKETPEPGNVQAFSVCFAMSHHEGEDHTVERPADYAFWRDFVPALTPPWSGRLLSLTGLSPRTMEPVHYNFAPNREPNTAFSGLWTYRRIIDGRNFTSPAYRSDITLVNYPQIDYLLGDLIGEEEKRRKGEKEKGRRGEGEKGGKGEGETVFNGENSEVENRKPKTENRKPINKDQLISDAKQQSLSFLYYLQTECGFPGLRLRPDVTGTSDGLAKMPYIRESRRIKALFTVREQHVAAAARPGAVYAERFEDSIGVGFYRIDLHPTTGGDNYVDVESLPFQIPLGALIPERTENLLPACKNIGTTHITNGCYRLHPIEWNIGEAAGHLAAFCLAKKRPPRAVSENRELRRELQERLAAHGFELAWPEGLNLADGDPHRHAM